MNSHIILTFSYTLYQIYYKFNNYINVYDLSVDVKEKFNNAADLLAKRKNFSQFIFL